MNGLAPLLAMGLISAATPHATSVVAAQDPLHMLRVPQALAGAALAPVTVAAVDTGADLASPRLIGRLWSNPVAAPAPQPTFATGPTPTVPAGAHGWDLLGTADNDSFPLQPSADPQDPVGRSGHGTAVGSILTAVAPNARLAVVRACWDDDDCYGSVVGPAMTWLATVAHARVITMSWLQPTPLDPSISRAIRDNPQTLFVAIPSGNDGPEDADSAATAPQPCGAGFDNVLCVSTSAPDDGLDCGYYGRNLVDVAVPTQGLTAAVNGGGTFTTGCATSYASPVAGGAAAILFGLDSGASGADVRAALVHGARPVAAWAGRSVSGGIVDVAAAAALLTPPHPTPRPLHVAVPRSLTTIYLDPLVVSVSLDSRARVTLVVTQARPGARRGSSCRHRRPRDGDAQPACGHLHRHRASAQRPGKAARRRALLRPDIGTRHRRVRSPLSTIAHPGAGAPLAARPQPLHRRQSMSNQGGRPMKVRPSYADVVSTVCLVLTLGAGTAYAATQIDGATIKNGSIAAKKLTSSAQRSLAGRTGAPGRSGPPGAQGQAGAPGAAGPPGPGATAISLDVAANLRGPTVVYAQRGYTISEQCDDIGARSGFPIDGTRSRFFVAASTSAGLDWTTAKTSTDPPKQGIPTLSAGSTALTSAPAEIPAFEPTGVVGVGDLVQGTLTLHDATGVTTVQLTTANDGVRCGLWGTVVSAGGS